MTLLPSGAGPDAVPQKPTGVGIPGRPGTDPMTTARQRRPSRSTALLGWTGGQIPVVLICAAFILVALLAPLLAPQSPTAQDQTGSLLPPSAAHWFGTDQLGRDVFSRLIIGTRVSVGVGLGATLVGLLVGGLFGVLAGVASGRMIDTVIMRIMDVIMSFPMIILAAVLAGLSMGREIWIGPIPLGQVQIVTLVIAVVLVPVFARIARASVLAEMREEYITAARVCGGRLPRLILRHLLPSIQAPLIVQAGSSVGIAIVTESAISFLGLGIQPPQPSWGNVLADGQQQLLLGAWWLLVFPTAAIVAATLCFNLLADALHSRARSREAGQRGPVKNGGA